MFIEETLENIGNFLKVKLSYNRCRFLDYKKHIKSNAQGIYIVFDRNDNLSYYAGKGKIRARQSMHVEKFSNEFKYAKDTKGFVYLRENHKYNTDNFDIIWINVDSSSLMSAVEGCLIYFLQPLANDEVVADKLVASEMKPV